MHFVVPCWRFLIKCILDLERSECLIDMKLARLFVLHRIRFLSIFNTFGWSILEIFDQAFFGFGKIGVPYLAGSCFRLIGRASNDQDERPWLNCMVKNVTDSKASC